ncbi:unnamed protein product [Ostreobium quekettii]|uniref:Uncharacterized protein n=1 Tax=Ostreobium quekettii TaxID=121088 RepID=A0A8S1J9B7_9CHLO|nr:unnamed protein product [Ostreobium quekettii]
MERSFLLAVVLAVLLSAAQQASSARVPSRRQRGPGLAAMHNLHQLPSHSRMVLDESLSLGRPAPAPASDDDDDAGMVQDCPDMRTTDGVPPSAEYSGDNAVVTYYNPQDSLSFLVDYCSRPSTGCGKDAANAFCERQGFDYALFYSKDSNAGFHCRPTRYTNDPGLFCKCSKEEDCTCDGFRYITCAEQ